MYINVNKKGDKKMREFNLQKIATNWVKLNDDFDIEEQIELIEMINVSETNEEVLCLLEDKIINPATGLPYNTKRAGIIKRAAAATNRKARLMGGKVKKAYATVAGRVTALNMAHPKLKYFAAAFGIASTVGLGAYLYKKKVLANYGGCKANATDAASLAKCRTAAYKGEILALSKIKCNQASNESKCRNKVTARINKLKKMATKQNITV